MSTVLTESGLRTEAVTSVVANAYSDIAGILDPWLSLCRQSSLVAPTAYPDSFQAECISNTPPCRPYVVLFSRADQPCGLVAGRLLSRPVSCRFGYARFNTPVLKCLEIVYGGLIAQGAGAAEAVLDHLAQMLRTGQVEHIMVNHVPCEDPLYAALSKRFAHRMVLRSVQKHHRYELTDSYDKLTSQFSSKHRKNVRRNDRTLVDHFLGNVKVERFSSSGEVQRFIRGAAQVAGKTYQAGLGVALTDSPYWRSILRTHAEAGRFLGHWLCCAGEPIAFQMGILCNNWYALQMLGYLPEHRELSPGGVLLQRVFQELCGQGVKGVDYGFGDADYKRIYGTLAWDEAVLHLYGPGLRSNYSRWMDRSVTGSSQLAHRVVDHLGGADRIKRLWRRRLSEKASKSEQPKPE